MSYSGVSVAIKGFIKEAEQPNKIKTQKFSDDDEFFSYDLTIYFENNRISKIEFQEYSFFTNIIQPFVIEYCLKGSGFKKVAFNVFSCSEFGGFTIKNGSDEVEDCARNIEEINLKFLNLANNIKEQHETYTNNPQGWIDNNEGFPKQPTFRDKNNIPNCNGFIDINQDNIEEYVRAVPNIKIEPVRIGINLIDPVTIQLYGLFLTATNNKLFLGIFNKEDNLYDILKTFLKEFYPNIEFRDFQRDPNIHISSNSNKCTDIIENKKKESQDLSISKFK